MSRAADWMVAGAAVLADESNEGSAIEGLSALLEKHGAAAVMEALRDALDCGADVLEHAVADDKRDGSVEDVNNLKRARAYATAALEAIR